MNAHERRIVSRKAIQSIGLGKAVNTQTGKVVCVLGKASPNAEKPLVRVLRGDKRKVMIDVRFLQKGE